MKTGIVDVGGGYRGIYASAVMDFCLDNNIKFDLGIGVSAGSANVISFAAGQKRRNHQFYTEYGLRKEYASFGNFIKKKSYIDMDYVYGTLSNSDGENPLDYNAIVKSPMDLYFVATNAETGKVKYFTKSDVKQDDYSVLKASCAIPFVCHPYPVGDNVYYDGALGDPVPIKKAFELGCDRVVLILTKPENTVRVPDDDIKLAKMIKRKYPNAAEKLCKRAQHYNESVELARDYAKHGRLLIVAPDDTCGIGTISRDKEKLEALYQKGYKDGEKILEFMK